MTAWTFVKQKKLLRDAIGQLTYLQGQRDPHYKGIALQGAIEDIESVLQDLKEMSRENNHPM